MMLDTVMEPEFVTKLVKFSTEVMKAYTKDIVKSDVDGAIICDPTASGSLISKPDYLRFVQPFQKDLGKIVKSSGKYLSCICAVTRRTDLTRSKMLELTYSLWITRLIWRSHPSSWRESKPSLVTSSRPIRSSAVPRLTYAGSRWNA